MLRSRFKLLINISMNTKSPLVSVCIISYNSAKTIVETLDSAAAQTYQNIELVVSDDCSTDNTVDVCKKWALGHPEINMQIVTTDKNTGVSGNLNRAIKISKGEWIKPMAADDILFEYSIERYVDYVLTNHKEVLVSKLDFFGDNLDNINFKKPYYDKYYNKYSKLSPQEQYKSMLQECILPMPGMFISKRLLEEIGYINERYPFGEEWPTYISIMKRGYDIPYVDMALVGYRCESDSLGSNTDNKLNVRVFRDTVKSFREFRRPLMLKKGLFLQAWNTTIEYFILANTYYKGRTNLFWRMTFNLLHIVNPLKYVMIIKRVFNV